MSNLLTNPIQITGSVPSYKQAVASQLGTLFTLEVQRLRWIAPPASSTLTIGDTVSGNPLEEMKSDASGEDIEIDYIPTRLWRDFSIDAFAGGTLLIFTR